MNTKAMKRAGASFHPMIQGGQGMASSLRGSSELGKVHLAYKRWTIGTLWSWTMGLLIASWS
jgi:hypothetical protein